LQHQVINQLKSIFYTTVILLFVFATQVFAMASSYLEPLSWRPDTIPARVVYQSESLRIEQLTPHTYVHVSQLIIPDYGSFPCNGMIYVNEGEAMVFDTPIGDTIAAELITWLREDMQLEVKGIVVNHFHDDCLSGLAAFHQAGIPSYANEQTIELARGGEFPLPQNGFADSLELMLGNEKVINRYFGPGHTRDNIVSYVPVDEVLFGGCMIKELGAGKGNLNDAALDDWANTVRKVRQTYPRLQHVIPGHGKCGGTELLDFTIGMFDK
jgi:metallo-beta-lactamase class B